MYGSEGIWGGRSRWWSVARALTLLVGSLVAAVGFVAATASLIAGFGLQKPGALRIAIVLGGAMVLATFLVPVVRGGEDRRAVASVGTVLALWGLALFWTALPSGWMGDFSALPPTALGTYAVGLLLVFATGVTVRRRETERGGSKVLGPETSVFEAGEPTVAGDGREEP